MDNETTLFLSAEGYVFDKKCSVPLQGLYCMNSPSRNQSLGQERIVSDSTSNVGKTPIWWNGLKDLYKYVFLFGLMDISSPVTISLNWSQMVIIHLDTIVKDMDISLHFKTPFSGLK